MLENFMESDVDKPQNKSINWNITYFRNVLNYLEFTFCSKPKATIFFIYFSFLIKKLPYVIIKILLNKRYIFMKPYIYKHSCQYKFVFTIKYK